MKKIKKNIKGYFSDFCMMSCAISFTKQLLLIDIRYDCPLTIIVRAFYRWIRLFQEQKLVLWTFNCRKIYLNELYKF